MNFIQLQTELAARGFDYLLADAAGQTRAKNWVNQSYQEICEEELWPFLLTTATGPAPLTVTDVRRISYITDTGQSSFLEPVEEQALATQYRDLTLTGTPTSYYIDNGVIRTYPVGGTLNVRYWKIPADLVADTDTPVIPSRFHNGIVDGAVRRAENDNDNYYSADQAEEERQLVLNLMRQSLLWQDGPGLITIKAGSGDW